MTKIKQKSDSRGSLKCIQDLINCNPSCINTLIFDVFEELANDEIIWVSPLQNDNYSEYRDHSFIDIVGLIPKEIQLERFWPKGGPQWDALAITSTKKVILVEAKANVREIRTTGTKAKELSKKLIGKSLTELKDFLEINNDVDWSSTYYQYTNRIAHLFYLREKCNVPVYLINIYFINDKTHIATKREKFELALKKLKNHLGLESHKLDPFIATIFINNE